MKNTLFLSLLLSLFIFACGPASESQPESATETETDPSPTNQLTPVKIDTTEMNETASDLDSKVQQLIQISNSIQVQGRELTPEELSLTEAISKVRAQYEEWKTKWSKPGLKKENPEEYYVSLKGMSEQVDQVLELASEK